MSGFAGLWLAVPDAPAAWLADGARLLANGGQTPNNPPPDANADNDKEIVVDRNDRWADAAAGAAWAVDGPEAAIAHGPAGRVVVAAVGLNAEDGDAPALPGQHAAAHVARVAEESGVEAALARWPGGVAGVLWERDRRRLTVVRDATGRWPLYYGWMFGIFAVGHDLRAFGRFARAFGPEGSRRREREWQPSSFRRLGQWSPEVDPRALAHVIKYGHVGWPLTIHLGFYMMPPGARLVLRSDQAGAEPLDFSPWPIGDDAPGTHPREWIEPPGDPRAFATPESAADAAGVALDDAVARHHADDGRPEGVALALSGGLDSALLAVRLARRARETGDAPPRAFTMGFERGAFDESAPAAAIARALGMEHRVLAIPDRELPELAREMPGMYDQPYGNPSAMPTLALFRGLAGAGVGTVYMGDGADEAFAGYRRHWVLPRWWQRLRRCPWILRRLASWVADAVPAGFVAGALARVWPVETARQGADGLWERSVAALAAWDALDFHHRFQAYGFRPEQVQAPWREWLDPDHIRLFPDSGGIPPARAGDGEDPWFRVFLEYDRTHGLINDGLVKIAGPARAAGLALRLPFLTPGVFRVARSCAPSALRGPAEDPTLGKQPLRFLLQREIPDENWVRPKRGFAAPVGGWLRGPLRDWAEALLDAKRLDETGWWRPTPLLRAWRRHLAGHVDAGLRLWPVLAVEQWRKPV